MKRRFTNEQVIRILREMAESRNEPVKDLCNARRTVALMIGPSVARSSPKCPDYSYSFSMICDFSGHEWPEMPVKKSIFGASRSSSSVRSVSHPVNTLNLKD